MKKLTFLTILVCSLLLPSAYGQKYGLGSKVQTFKANDQHGNAYQLDSNTRYLLLSFDMDTGKKANASLDQKGKDYFGKKKIAYVANIHGMPGIGRMFAFKKMKKYSHRIIYGDDANLMTPFPEAKGHVTVFRLDDKQKVTRISYWNPLKEDIESHIK